MLSIRSFVIVIESDAEFSCHIALRGYFDVLGGGKSQYVDKPFLGCVLINLRDYVLADPHELQQLACLLWYLMQVSHTPAARFAVDSPQVKRGPLLLGGAVATFFNGSNFLIDKGNITNSLQPVISRWANASHGLDALLAPWTVVLGLAVLMLARILGMLYIKNNIEHQQIQERCTRQLPWNALLFLLFFLPFLIRLLVKDGFSTSSSGITIESMKYLHNLLEMPILLVILLIGVVLVLFGIFKSSRSVQYRKGIWFTGIGTVLTVLVLLLIAGWNNTAYYPSNIDLQSSLTLANSCSSEFTLRTMAIVSLLIPFVLAYIVFAWRAIDRKRITQEEIEQGEAY